MVLWYLAGGRICTWISEEESYNPCQSFALLERGRLRLEEPLLKYTIMTHGAEPSLPRLPPLIKTQLPRSGEGDD